MKPDIHYLMNHWGYLTEFVTYPISLVKCIRANSSRIPRLPAHARIQECYVAVDDDDSTFMTSPTLNQNMKSKSDLQCVHLGEKDCTEQTNIAVVQDLFHTRGISGLFDGALRTLLLKHIETRSTQKINDLLAPDSAEPAPESDLTSLANWHETDLIRHKVISRSAEFIVGSFIYPLRLINNRCILYRPVDGLRMKFLDMMKASVVYDGPKVLFRGYTAFSIAKTGSAILDISISSLLSYCSNRELINTNLSSLIQYVPDACNLAFAHLEARSEDQMIVSAMPGLSPFAYKKHEGRMKNFLRAHHLGYALLLLRTYLLEIRGTASRIQGIYII